MFRDTLPALGPFSATFGFGLRVQRGGAPWVKFAVTLVRAPPMRVTEQVLVPAHTPPDQPANAAPRWISGLAVSVTCVPAGSPTSQVELAVMLPATSDVQLISEVIPAGTP